MTMIFKDFKELRKFLKGPKEFVEPERIEEVKDEVPPKKRNRRKPKADASKVGEPAENADKD